jgi:hypothetical protein
MYVRCTRGNFQCTMGYFKGMLTFLLLLGSIENTDHQYFTINMYRGSSPYVSFGSLKMWHKPKIAIGKYLANAIFG